MSIREQYFALSRGLYCLPFVLVRDFLRARGAVFLLLPTHRPRHCGVRGKFKGCRGCDSLGYAFLLRRRMVSGVPDWFKL